MKYQFDKYTEKKIVGTYTEAKKTIPVIDDLDVLIVGGSPSGVAAAVAAGRQGVNVLLVERYGFLGGQSVFSSVTQWEKRAFINNLGAVATRGIAKEMIDRIISLGNSDGLWETPPGSKEMRDGEEWLDVEDIKIVLMRMCEEAGVEILFHTLAVDVIVKPETNNDRMNLPRLEGVIFENKTGRFAYRAQTIVDATADVDLVWRAVGDQGVRMVPPDQRINASFYVYFGGIDSAKFVEWILKQENLKTYPNIDNPEKVKRHLEESKLIKLGNFEDLVEKADEMGFFTELEEIYENEGIIVMIKPGMKWVGQDRWCVSFGSLKNVNLLDVWELSQYERIRTKIEHLGLKIMRLLPGWENSYISRTNVHMGQRQTRSLRANYMLTKKDIFKPDHDRPDVIGRSNAHDPGKNKLKAAYPIPYGILVPKSLDGCVVCTRAVGCAERTAVGAHRGITPGIVVGQAAGVAAALSSKQHNSPHELNVADIQKVLRDSDVVLDKEVIDLDL